MKTYNKVVHKALLVGASSYFGGGSIYDGVRVYADAVEFIYNINRDVFAGDVEYFWKKLQEKMVVENMSSDDVIKHIKDDLNHGTLNNDA